MESLKFAILENALKSFRTPLLQRRGGCAIKKIAPFLSGADGVVKNYAKEASRHLF